MVFIKKNKNSKCCVSLYAVWTLSASLFSLLVVNEDAERESSVEKRNTTVVFIFSPRFTVFRSVRKNHVCEN
jgi:hypothetical protein